MGYSSTLPTHRNVYSNNLYLQGVYLLSDTDTTAVLVTDMRQGELRKYPLIADSSPVSICTDLNLPSGVTAADDTDLICVCGHRMIYLISQNGK